MRFEIFMDVKTHNVACWIMAPFSLVNGYIGQRARRVLKFDTVCSSETSGDRLSD
jgi:hypothetical protein